MTTANKGTASLEQLLSELQVAVIVVERDSGIIRYINDRVCRDVGKPHNQICGQSYRQVFWPEFVPAYESLLLKCADNSEHTANYYWSEMRMWEQVSATTILHNDVPCILLSITDISELTYAKCMSDERSFFDRLLNLPNGTKLEEDINDLAGIEALNLIYFVIERYEEINDLYGWESGDLLLAQIRDWLLSSETRRIQLYRVGGNGFVMLGRNVTYEGTKNRAHEIVERFTHPWLLSAAGNTLSIFCTVRVGVVHKKYIRNEMRSLLHRTLQTPPNEYGYSIYDDNVDAQTKRMLKLRDGLINCILNGMKGFSVYYQPIVETATRQWAAAEALCRWQLPSGENIQPGEFIPIAEQLGMVGLVDDWVRDTAMQQCVSMGLGEKNFVLNINFSPTRALSASYIGDLQNALEQTGFPAGKLNLEVTESAKMNFGPENMRGLRQLTDTGIILSLDDFGTGYSSLENLIHISATILKMEKLFLDGIEQDNYRQYLLQMLVNLAEHLEKDLISEGVESEAQYDLLKRLGVRYSQGFLFGRPRPFEQFCREAGQFA